QYNPAASPFTDRWPYAYQVEPHENGEDVAAVYRNQETYRKPDQIEKEFVDIPRIVPDWVGFYDPSKLDISKDPKNELPMETYRPATAEMVLNAEKDPVNPPIQLKPNGDPYDFLT